MFRIELLPARHGDCILIGYGPPKSTRWILIDAGTEPTWPDLRTRLASVPRLELFVLTHIDADHIAGAIPFLAEANRTGFEIGDVWFNGWPQIADRRHANRSAGPPHRKPDRTLSAKQGEIFSALLTDPAAHRRWNGEFGGGPVQVTQAGLPVVELPGSMRLTVLSPTPAKLGALRATWSRQITRHGLVPGRHAQFRRFLARQPETRTDSAYLAATRFTSDASVPNGSSIAVLAEHAGRAALFAGDAVSSVLITSIRRLLADRGDTRLRLDAFKVAHHGSRGNTSMQLLSLLDCPRYLVSCNGDVHQLPDNEAIGRIIQGGGPQPQLIFNYDCARTVVWGTAAGRKANPGYTAVYGDGGHVAIDLQRRSRSPRSSGARSPGSRANRTVGG